MEEKDDFEGKVSWAEMFGKGVRLEVGECYGRSRSLTSHGSNSDSNWLPGFLPVDSAPSILLPFLLILSMSFLFDTADTLIFDDYGTECPLIGGPPWFDAVHLAIEKQYMSILLRTFTSKTH